MSLPTTPSPDANASLPATTAASGSTSILTLVASAKTTLPSLFDPTYLPDQAADAAVLDHYLDRHQSAESRRVLGSVAARLAAIGGYSDVAAAPWPALHAPALEKLRNLLKDGGVPTSTVNLLLSVAKGIAGVAYRHGRLTSDGLTQLREVQTVRGGSGRPRGRALPVEEVRSLIAHCLAHEGAVGRRDAALLALAYGCGFRRAELASLTLDRSVLWQDAAIEVVGKGNKIRTVPIPAGARAILQAWFDVRPAGGGPLFIRFEANADRDGARPPVRVGGRLQALSTTRIYQIVTARASQAGLAHTSPHDLRRTFATVLLDAQVHVHVVAEMLGHASINTTRIYDRSGQAAARKAVAHLEF